MLTPLAIIWNFIRREPLYHKLQYSKVPKFDPAAAVLGVAIGAFVVYMTLSAVGSAGTDLTDLTLGVWYAGVLWTSLWLWGQEQKFAPLVLTGHVQLWVQLAHELTALVLNSFKR
jgi:hypothetical protein